MDFIVALLVKAAAKAWETNKKIEAEAKERQMAQERVENARREKQERAQHCCAACAAIVSSKVVFCHNCGGATITTVGTIRDIMPRKSTLRGPAAA